MSPAGKQEPEDDPVEAKNPTTPVPMSTLTPHSLIATIGKLDGSNYYDWIFDVEMVARRSGVWGTIQGKDPEPSEDATETLKTAHERREIDALTMIGLTVAKSELVNIRGCDTAHEMWEALAAIYAKSSRANRIALRQQLAMASLGPDDKVQDYVSRVSDIATRLRAVGVQLEDEDVVDVLIMNLPEEWGHVASSLMIRPGDLTVKEVVGVLLEEETRRYHKNAQASAMYAQATRRKGAGKGNGGDGKGRASASDWRRCFRCDQKGHVVADCPEPPVKVETANVARVLPEDNPTVLHLRKAPNLYNM